MAKILIVSKYYYPFNGGIEENVRYVAEYAARFHEVTVVASNHEPGNSEEEINGVRVLRRRVHLHAKGQPICLFFLSGLRLGHYDLVHFHSPNPFANAVFLGLRLFSQKVPVVVTHHMDIFGRKFLRKVCLPFLHRLVRAAFVTVVTSKKNLTVSQDLPKSANYTVVPLGVAQEDYQIDGELREAAMVWRRSLSGDAPVVGFIGRHARYKGLLILMEALALLPGVHAFIGGDGPYRKAAQEKALALGIQDRVHFFGRLDHHDKLKLLAALDVFAFPSTEITEAFGISQMEAMMCGTPVVASDLPTGVTDVAVDGRTALLVSPGDPAQLAEQINRLIGDPALAAELSAAARTHILEKMTHATVSRQMLSIFEAAMSGGPIGAGVRLI